MVSVYVMIWDGKYNNAFHKRVDMVKAIESHQYAVEFPLSYKPDLNLIAHEWAQTKSTRGKIQCSVDELLQNYAN